MLRDPQVFVDRVRKALSRKPIREQRMFGGIVFMIDGNMLCCVSKKGLMVRVGKEAEPAALASPRAKRCRATGRPMRGFVVVDSEGVAADANLARWLAMACAYVETLPPKPARSGRKPTAAPRRAARFPA